MLTDTDLLSFVSVINPFDNNLTFEVAALQNGKAYAELIDPAGKTVKKTSFEIATGVNRLTIDNTEILSGGIYFLRVNIAGHTIQRRVIKQTQ